MYFPAPRICAYESFVCLNVLILSSIDKRLFNKVLSFEIRIICIYVIYIHNLPVLSPLFLFSVFTIERPNWPYFINEPWISYKSISRYHVYEVVLFDRLE